MTYKCIMCQDPIEKEKNQWGLEIRPLCWIHYRCIEHLWDTYSSMVKGDFMTEPKPYWIGGYQPTGKPPEVLNPPKGGSNVIDPKQGYSISPEKPTSLPPGSPPQPIYKTLDDYELAEIRRKEREAATQLQILRSLD